MISVKEIEKKSDLVTPKGKRKRVDGDGKENQPAQGVKMARKLLGDKGTNLMTTLLLAYSAHVRT